MAMDGLTDPFDHSPMGKLTDSHNARLGIGRAEQDEFAARSHQRAAAAIKDGMLAEEIVAVGVPQRRGETIRFDTDEGVRPDTTAEALSRLRPAFGSDGTITAGSASQISDGACAVVVMSRAAAERFGAPVLAEVGHHGVVAGPDASLQSQPANAVNKALTRAGMTTGELDLVEINEAFASVAIQSTRELGIDPDRVNVNGGAIALGHPVGSTGTRLLTTALHELERRDGASALVAMCAGGAMASGTILERL